jgi:hypothetical protein
VAHFLLLILPANSAILLSIAAHLQRLGRTFKLSVQLAHPFRTQLPL